MIIKQIPEKMIKAMEERDDPNSGSNLPSNLDTDLTNKPNKTPAKEQELVNNKHKRLEELEDQQMSNHSIKIPW